MGGSGGGVLLRGRNTNAKALFSDSSAFSGDDWWKTVVRLKILSDFMDTLPTSRSRTSLPALLYTTFEMASILFPERDI
jgi:hypothetical protein